ncbi:MAG: zinc ABC transporter substrate-binding protein [Chryseobacterium sp.]|nr:MAG: zinc ABC transporter substrate-binding protein [Chryseobacterium sp.]
MIKRIATFCFGILLLAGLCSCSDKQQSTSGNAKLQVVSSFSILSDMVAEIGGDKVAVHNLVPVGMAPHEYEPKPDDIKLASRADALFYNGLNLEGGESGWLMKLVQSVGISSAKIFAVTDGIAPKYIGDRRGAREINPHAFISPKAGMVMAANIKNALISIDKANSAYYEARAQRYVAALQKLDDEYKNKIKSLPEADRVFMASEQAFQYLTSDYGLKEGFIWAIDTDKNGTPEQIKSAINFVQANRPPVLFVESNVDRRPMETISESTGVPIFPDPILSDELGKRGTPGDTYLKYLQYNLDRIYSGLSRK